MPKIDITTVEHVLLNNQCIIIYHYYILYCISVMHFRTVGTI